MSNSEQNPGEQVSKPVFLIISYGYFYIVNYSHITWKSQGDWTATQHYFFAFIEVIFTKIIHFIRTRIIPIAWQMNIAKKVYVINE